MFVSMMVVHLIRESMLPSRISPLVDRRGAQVEIC